MFHLEYWILIQSPVALFKIFVAVFFLCRVKRRVPEYEMLTQKEFLFIKMSCQSSVHQRLFSLASGILERIIYAWLA